MIMLGKNNKGITLVALVITIVILLILAGISISTLTNTGIFEKAKDAKKASENAELEQNKVLDEYEKELDKYEDNTLVSKFNSGKIKVGDYVSYKPDEAGTSEILDELRTYARSDSNDVSALIQEMELKWRVLDVKDGHVRLISETPTTSKIIFQGYNGYNNAVKLLDDASSILYTNSMLAIKVQNLKIEDVQEKIKEKEYTKFVDNEEYGKRFIPNTSFYPSILLKEKEQKVIIGDDTIIGAELDLSEQNSLVEQIEEKQADELDVKNTYWKKSMVIEDFIEEMYYELFIDNEKNDNAYWMSSRCIDSYSKRAGFNIRYVGENNITARALCDSYVNAKPSGYSFRPVVTLKSNIRLDIENSGNGSIESPFNIE